MGSLQQRYLRAGCLSSKPLLLLFACGLGQLLAGGAEGARAATARERSAPPPAAAPQVEAAASDARDERGPAGRSLHRTSRTHT
jgi:hypothetical protein